MATWAALSENSTIMIRKTSQRSCSWRNANSRTSLRIAGCCYDCAVRDLAVLLVHVLATVARLAVSGGARAVVAESVLVKQQLLIVNV